MSATTDTCQISTGCDNEAWFTCDYCKNRICGTHKTGYLFTIICDDCLPQFNGLDEPFDEDRD